MNKPTLSSTGGIITAIIASLCCIGPIVLALIGVSSVGLFSVFEAYRPYLISLTVLLLGVAFYFTYRKREVKCEDGSCRVERAGVWNKIGVWCATLIAIGAIAFPYFGFTAPLLPPKPSSDNSTSVAQEVSFFDVPLVCNAAPSIGCGSRAKFIMLDLMKDSTVKGAWLNRRGTVMAVVWNEATSLTSRGAALKSVFSQHDLPLEQVNERDRNGALIEDLKNKDTWYKGSDVDALSVQEAGVIADRLLAVVSRHAKFGKYEDRQAFREEVKANVQSHFLSIKSFDELDASNRMQQDIFATAVKYLGKENLPDPKILREEYGALRDEDEACCKDSSQGAACCAKDKHEK